MSAAAIATGDVRRACARLAADAAEALRAELDAYPKPGLVSRTDAGSHADMSCATYEASIAVLTPFFAELAEAGARHATMDALRRTGIAAERAMLEATGGANTHRGAIFGLGLLVAAAGARHAAGRRDLPLGGIVRRLWGSDILRAAPSAASHGAEACRRHGVGGARAEAAAGFPSVAAIGLPGLRDGRRRRPGDDSAASVQCLMALIASVDDTNLLHRGGADGAAWARAAAAAFLDAGGVGQHDWFARAADLHRLFVRRRLSPGGCADLLAMTLFADRVGAGGETRG